MAQPRTVHELPTPALVVDLAGFDANIKTMSDALPGDLLRPHVKAHKCTALARRQYEAGHHNFTCATIREMEGMAAAGLGDDLLLANEVLDASRLGQLGEKGARVTLAVDSDETIAAAARGGVREVLIDVNVGLPRCGCDPADAARLADLARRSGLEVRGVMGYEGHAVGIEDLATRTAQVTDSGTILAAAHKEVGGPLASGGGTGSYDLNRWCNEIQAGSYVLMDTAYAKLGLPFGNALSILATVVSVNRQGWAVADCGLKCLGMDHGNPSITDGSVVWFCSDEHITFSPAEGASLPKVGDRIRVLPGHIDPTIAYHNTMWVTSGPEIIDSWPVDLRWW